MKILIITPRIPYPPFRGDKLKIYNISKILSANNSVTVLTFYENSKSLEHVSDLEKQGIRTIAVKLSIVESLLNLLPNLFSSTPFQVAYFSSSKMRKKIKELTDTEDFDVVYFHLIRSAQYLESVSKKIRLKVLDFTDAVSLYLHRFVEVTKNPFKKIALKIELKRITKYEGIAKNFDTLFICSEKDKEFLESRKVCDRIEFLRNGIDLNSFKRDNVVPVKHRIIFTGNMPYFPNKDAVMHFTKDIFPIVLKKYQDAKFYIVGQKPPANIQSLASEKIIVTGFVPDIKREYLLSEVNVVPIRFGAGTLNKVIESMALGVPTVATSLSIGGLPDELKKYIYVGDTADEFAERIFEVFENREEQLARMNDACKVVDKLLNWNKIVVEFETYLNKRLEQIRSGNAL